MFNKEKFSQILSNINNTYPTMTEFAEKSGVNRTYLSQYINKKLNSPPTPKILKKIANASNGIISYKQLMLMCNYLDDGLNDISNECINLFGNPYIDRTKYSTSEEYIFNVIYSYEILGVSNYTDLEKKKITDSYNYIKNDKDYSKYLIKHAELKKRYYEKAEYLNLVKKEKIESKTSTSSAVVFIYGTIPAGIPMECIEDIIGTEEISVDMLKGGKEYFGLKIKGNSMYPEYLDGDIIILQKVEDCESGQDCVVMVNGNDGTFKRVFKNETGIILQPLNSQFQPLIYTNEQIKSLPVKVIGKVVELRRKK